MKRSLAITLLAATFAAPAFAADMAVKAPMPRAAATQIYDWTGLYLGLNAGGGWSHNCWTQHGYNVPVVSFNGSPFLGISNVNNASEGCSDASGAIVGGQIGYRHQLGSFVFGIEAQGDWADLSGSNASPVLGKVNTFLNNLPGRFAGGASLTNTTKVDAIGMFTGQVGYTVLPALLWYVKGGVAVTDNKYSGAAAANIGTIASVSLTDAARAIKFGGVVGTGLEWAFAPDWSIGAEYNHLFMGSDQVGLAYTGNTVNVPGFTAANIAGIPSRNESISSDIDMATVRLNYRFSSH
jgi:outer membrane immunogenic protein